MRRFVLGIAATALLAIGPGAAVAQSPGLTNPSSFAPNMFNRSGQPLSPYLNLLRGANPAVNYFYGVRPGTQPGAFQAMIGQLGAGPRMTFFPGADYLTDLAEDPRDPSKVAPTGHATSFGNTQNFFGPTSGQFFTRGAQPQRRR